MAANQTLKLVGEGGEEKWNGKTKHKLNKQIYFKELAVYGLGSS